MPSQVPVLVLTQNCEVKPAKVSLQSEEQGCQLSDIQKYLKKKTAATVLGTYSWKNQTLHLIGYKDGKAGTENQHELPPPLDKDLYFGDIILLLTKEKKSIARPLLMKSDEYETFYTQMFEGFEDLQDSDSDDEEEEYEEEEEAEAEQDEGEFEENEDQVEFSDDDNDDHEEVEEFDAPVKKEDDEDDVLPVLVKKKAAKATTSKAKAKALKDSQVPLYPTGVELKHEDSVEESGPQHANRQAVFGAIQRQLPNILTRSQALELEHYIFNASLQIATKRHISKIWSQPLFHDVYLSLARNVVGNLNPNSYINNKDLYRRFNEGKVSLEEITNFGFSDLYPEIWKELSIRQFEREKRLLEGNKSMATDQFECKRCHKRECTYYELQTRSADEPMTIFIQCVNCGKHWRQ